MKKGQLFFVLLIIAGIGWLSYWFLNNFERDTKQVNLGAEGEALHNPWLAAEFFLRKGGINSHYETNLDMIDSLPPNATLYITNTRDKLHPRHNQKLLDWANNGGHLIISPRYETYYEDSVAEDDTLISSVSVWVREAETPPAADERSPEDFSDIEWQVDFGNYGYVLTTSSDQAVWGIDDNDGLQLVQLRHGKGYITVINELFWGENDYIAEQDHAKLLYRLASQNDGDFIIWRKQDMPWLPVWLYQKAPELIISLILFIGLILLANIPRFGKIREIDEQPRRQWQEHIEASGHFLWHYQQQLLLDACKQHLLSDTKKRRPDISQPFNQHSYQLLAKTSNLEADNIQHLMQANAATKKPEFTRQIQLLQQIRKSL